MLTNVQRKAIIKENEELENKLKKLKRKLVIKNYYENDNIIYESNEKNSYKSVSILTDGIDYTDEDRKKGRLKSNHLTATEKKVIIAMFEQNAEMNGWYKIGQKQYMLENIKADDYYVYIISNQKDWNGSKKVTHKTKIRMK